MAAIKRLASKACGPEIDYDHGHDYNLITAEGWQPELSSARRAAVRAEKAMQSAQAGDTMATLSGNIVVSQAIFAELLKRGQEANTQLLEEMQAKDREISDLRAKLEAHEAMRCDFADIQAGIGKQDAKDLEIAKLRARLEAQEAIERNLADLRANIEEQVVKDREIANLRASLGAYEGLGSQLEDLRAIIEGQVAKDREIAESRMRLEALDDIDQQVMDLRASRESQDVKDREIDELRAKVDAHEATGIAAAEAASIGTTTRHEEQRQTESSLKDIYFFHWPAFSAPFPTLLAPSWTPSVTPFSPSPACFVPVVLLMVSPAIQSAPSSPTPPIVLTDALACGANDIAGSPGHTACKVAQLCTYQHCGE